MRCTRAGNVPAVVGLGRNNPLTSGAAHRNAGRSPCACVRLQRGEMPPAAPAGSFTRGLSSPNESGPQKRSPQERRRQQGPSGSEIARRAAGARGAAPSGGSASPWRCRPVPRALSSPRTDLGSCSFGVSGQASELLPAPPVEKPWARVGPGQSGGHSPPGAASLGSSGDSGSRSHPKALRGGRSPAPAHDGASRLIPGQSSRP